MARVMHTLKNGQVLIDVNLGHVAMQHHTEMLPLAKVLVPVDRVLNSELSGLAIAIHPAIVRAFLFEYNAIAAGVTSVKQNTCRLCVQLRVTFDYVGSTLIEFILQHAHRLVTLFE